MPNHFSRRTSSLFGAFGAATIASLVLWQFKPALAQKEATAPENAMNQKPTVDPLDTRATVGVRSDGTVVLPQNQILTPAGRQIPLQGMRPQALALSPDGRLLVTAGITHELVVLDPATGAELQRVPLPSEKSAPAEGPVSSHILQPDPNGQLSYSGLAFSSDGTRLYLSSVNGSVKAFAVADGKVTGLNSFALPQTGLSRRQEEIPCGLAVSSDGTKLYVAGNLSNTLLELDAATGRVLRHFAVGFAPYDVVVVGDKAYVSNWGGRRPDAKSTTGPAGRGTLVRVDNKRFIASEGSVSVVDLDEGKVEREIVVGRHACAMALSPHKRYLIVAGAAEDTLSVLDTRSDAIIETIGVRIPGDFFGAVPDALTFSPSGQTLFVCLGGRNAVASIAFKPGQSQVRGLIPVGWFPGAIIYDAAHRTLGVANIKGTGSGRGPKFNTYQYNGMLSLVPLPDAKGMRQFTRTVLTDARQSTIEAARLPARPNHPPRPVPQRIGEPSTFQHVVYIIKENRTYDQVLGDVKEGNGDVAGCIFGADVTPNLHKIVGDFTLLDNTYCSGVLSADGHQWADSGFATDYMERSFAGFPRSYPDGMEENDVDALAYSPAGFIWDNAIKHGKTLRDYGEFTIGATSWQGSTRKGRPRFADFLSDYVRDGQTTKISSEPAIESLRPYICPNTIGWDLHVPDVLRAQRFITELNQFEQNGKFPQMTLICLPNDHTSGTGAGSPTPAAQVADNDLAMGQIVDAISHSRFWKDTCIFAIEDDPQAGWDHVSAYRTTAYVVSPYTKRHSVVSTQYNQPALLRTMELILGLPPMNTMDAAATPMFDCFTGKPDFTPYNAVPSKVRLDQMNPVATAIRDPLRRRYALLSAKLPLKEADQCPEDLLNHILWNARKGSAPYPYRNPKDGPAPKHDDDD